MNPAADQPALSLPGAIAGGEPLHRFAHDAMACTWGIAIVGANARYAAQAARTAFAEVDRLEQELSRFVPHSDIGRINALPVGQSLLIGADACQCLSLAGQVGADTHGAFDVTVNTPPPISPAGEAAPSPAERPPLLHFDRPRRQVTVSADHAVVDLGGIAKGYAVDQAVEILGQWGLDRVLVHSGQSTVLARGCPPAAEGWPVAIRYPADPARSLGTLFLVDRAFSGSGATWHGPHIIDPRTGQPPTGASAAWSLAPSAALADALSTAFMVMSPLEVNEYCRKHPDIGALVLRDA